MMVYVATVQYEGMDTRGKAYTTYDVIDVFYSEKSADEALNRVCQMLIKQGYKNISSALWRKYVEE